MTKGTQPSRGNILFFCLSVADLHWSDLAGAPHDAQEEIALLANAIAVDSADHWSTSLRLHAILCTTHDCSMDGITSLPESIEVVTQHAMPLHRRMAEALRSFGETKDGSPTVLVIGKNPLYPITMLHQGISLLGQEDDVVVIGEGLQGGNHQRLMWVAAKNHHPEIVEHFERETDPASNLPKMTAGVHGLVMVMRAVREIGCVEDFAYLLHETERAVLLKQWYPSRTYELLTRLQSHGVIPGVHT